MGNAPDSSSSSWSREGQKVLLSLQLKLPSALKNSPYTTEVHVGVTSSEPHSTTMDSLPYMTFRVLVWVWWELTPRSHIHGKGGLAAEFQQKPQGPI